MTSTTGKESETGDLAPEYNLEKVRNKAKMELLCS
jgi:hypothetical protein